MRPWALLAVAFSVWTYGSEPMDILMGRGEWEGFARELRCEVRKDDHVWCLANGTWATIDNHPLLVPWGLE